MHITQVVVIDMQVLTVIAGSITDDVDDPHRSNSLDGSCDGLRRGRRNGENAVKRCRRGYVEHAAVED